MSCIIYIKNINDEEIIKTIINEGKQTNVYTIETVLQHIEEHSITYQLRLITAMTGSSYVNTVAIAVIELIWMNL